MNIIAGVSIAALSATASGTGGTSNDGSDTQAGQRTSPTEYAYSKLAAENDRLFLWLPVVVGCGILSYFALPAEPSVFAIMTLWFAAAGLRFALARGTLVSLAAGLLLTLATGFAIAKLRTEIVGAPVLERRMNSVEVAGVIELVEPRPARGQRLTLRVLSLADVSSDKRPAKVRVRILKDNPALRPGMTVKLKANLAPPAKPALPGGFDFARSAYYLGLGGVGYSFSPVEIIPETGPPSLRLQISNAIETLRQSIRARIVANLPGEQGAIATALITGERGGISAATTDAFRDSGLLHILSISGLHMVIMAGAVFYAVRVALAAIPGLALRYEIKKWAACAGIIGALGYLAISGGAFATVRSAITVIVMFLAVLAERPALSLRNVALAALLIMIVYPESVLDPGFQMSFAAVVALVAAHEEVRTRRSGTAESSAVTRITLFFGAIIFSTIIASLAVAPIAAYHFHKSQQYAMLANVTAIPICNVIVMPSALAALVLMPFGLEGLALWPMGIGISMMTWCAEAVAKIPGAVGRIPAVLPAAFAMMIFGGLWLTLWKKRWRLLGLPAIAIGVVLAPFLPRPSVLVSRGGELVAVRAPDGALSALPARQSNFELQRWLEYDGDSRTTKEVQAASAFTCDGVGCTANVSGVSVSVARHPASVIEDCKSARIVVLAVPRPKSCSAPQIVIDVFDIWRRGTHAVHIGQDGAIRVETVDDHRGIRPWSQPLPAHDSKQSASKGQAAPPESGPAADQAIRGSGNASATDYNRDEEAPAGSAEHGKSLPRFTTRPDFLSPGLSPGSQRPEVEDDEITGDDPPDLNREPGNRDPGPSAPAEPHLGGPDSGGPDLGNPDQ